MGLLGELSLCFDALSVVEGEEQDYADAGACLSQVLQFLNGVFLDRLDPQQDGVRIAGLDRRH